MSGEFLKKRRNERVALESARPPSTPLGDQLRLRSGTGRVAISLASASLGHLVRAAERGRGPPLSKSPLSAVLRPSSFVLASSEAERLCHSVFTRGEEHCSRVRFFHRKGVENAEHFYIPLLFNMCEYLFRVESFYLRQCKDFSF
jgi:hypothetical protein